MELETLRWFQEVAEGHTVTEVAQTYRVSQPAVSRALARLDTEVGTPLLRRSGRVLRPTHAGMTLKRHVDKALHAMDDAEAAVQELLDPESGRVVVAFQPSLGMWLIPDLVASFRRRHPRVVFSLLRAQQGNEEAALIEGTVDLDLGGRRPSDPAIGVRRLLREPLMLAVSHDHPLAQLNEVWLRDVAAEDFITLHASRRLSKQTEELCAAAGFAPRVAFHADDLPTAIGFVGAGLGVAVVPGGATRSQERPDQPGRATNALTRLDPQVRLIPLADAGAARDLVLTWSTQRRLLPSAELFRRHVIDDLTRRTHL